MQNQGNLSGRELTRSRRRERVEVHLKKVRELLKEVLDELETSSVYDLIVLRNEICEHEADALRLLAKLGKTETLLDQVLSPMQHLGTIKELENDLNEYDYTYDNLTNRRRKYREAFNDQKRSTQPTKQSHTLARIQESIPSPKSDNTNTVRHMKSSPVIGGSKSNQSSPISASTNNLAVPSNHGQFHRSFEDLKSTYAESLEGDVGCFKGLLPGSQVALKKGTLDIPPSFPVIAQHGGQEASMNPSSPQAAMDKIDQRTDTPKWAPGGPIISKESMDIMDREWFEKNKDALAETKARFLQEASSSYQSYAPVRQEYDIYNPPPREPTPTMDPPSLPPPPRRRRQLAPIVTESEPKEEPKEEEGSETVVRHRKKGKSKTRSPRSAKGNTSPRTPSEVTENVFGAPESGEDSNPWSKQGLLQIQGRDADDPLAQWNRGRESFEAA